MGIAAKNKEEKRQRLLDAAYELFLEKGSVQTTIDDIVRRGRVAKGTFYLYFQDKTTIHDALTLTISRRLVAEAAEHAEKETHDCLADNIVAFADYIIEYFKRQPEVLRLVQHNFNWMLFQNEIDKEDDPLINRLRTAILDSEEMKGRSIRQIRDLVFILTQMVGSVCYTAIVRGQPAGINELKPMLYSVIRDSLNHPHP